MTAITSIFLPDSNWISNVVTDCSGGLCDSPPIPETLTGTCLRCRERLCAKRSEMNEAQDALSSRALASVSEPSGALINTRQVTSRRFERKAVLDWVLVALCQP